MNTLNQQDHFSAISAMFDNKTGSVSSKSKIPIIQDRKQTMVGRIKINKKYYAL